MNDELWRQFFLTSARVLGEGEYGPRISPSWCSWTTFDRLLRDAKYWSAGLPRVDEIADYSIRDGGVWGQPFRYSELAHVIIPRQFHWEHASKGAFEEGSKGQDIELLSTELTSNGIDHRKTDLILEIKLY